MKEPWTNEMKEQIDDIEIPEERLNRSIEFAIHRGKKERRKFPVNRFMLTASAAVVLFGLFIGSAFVSPAMASMVAKIPYLGKIVVPENGEDVVQEIADELEEKYTIMGMGVSYPEKVIQIYVEGDESYYKKVKSDVKQTAKEVLRKRHLNAYGVEVNLGKEEVMEPTEEEKRNSQEFKTIYDELAKEADKRGFNLLQTSVDYGSRELQIEIPSNEDTEEEIKEILDEIVGSHGMDEISVSFKKINMEKRDQDKRWREILSLLQDDLLGKQKYKVRMVGYSVHPEPEIQAFLSLSEKDDNAKAFAEELEKAINEVLQSDKLRSKVKDDDYHINIYSKEDKILNQ
jgi:Protein of unknown function (DUF4030)